MSPLPKNEDDGDDVEEIGLEAGHESEEQPEEEDDHHDKTTLALAGYSVEVDNRALPYVGVVFAAVILLVASIVRPGTVSNRGYGIAVCIVAIILGLIGVYLTLKNASLYDNELGTVPMLGTLTYGRVFANTLLIWNFIGACILTFDGPFTVTSNGYFAAWFCVLFAVMATGVTVASVRSRAADLGLYNGLMFASIIQLCAVIPEMGGDGGATFSLILCILTIIAVLAFGAYPNISNAKLPVFAVLSICWIVMASLVTFRGPFLATGNGYFSAWAGCILCVMLAGSLAP